LADYDPDFTEGYEKETAQSELEVLQTRLAELQERLYAEGQQSLLLVLQAMDTGGKDGTIKNVFRQTNPQGIRVTSFKAPSELELAHDFLWRIHQQVPPKGYIGVFNRSHYEDVLVVRVNNLVPKPVWEARYDRINHFEAHLNASGVTILKVYLHISKAEQKERLQARLDDPTKHWKFSLGDLPVRQQWDDYMQAYEAALTRCNSKAAPWWIIPANKKWYRNLAVTRLMVQTLEKMNPQFPTQTADLAGVTISD
jgi:PPK2 family polyphosphate:nucleotide phosphotransferase